MATLAAESTVKACFKGQTCKKQVTDVIIEIARWIGVALTASDINNDNIEKYLDALDIPIDFISLVQPSDIGERVTMTGVDVLVKHGMDTDKAKEFLQNLTFEQSHLMAIAVSDRMGDSFFEDVVLKTYERYGGENQLASESNGNSDSQASAGPQTGLGTASGGASLPPDDDDDDKSNQKDSPPKTLQSGGNTLNQNTADKLNQNLGANYHRRDWGRALEELKKDFNLRNDHHGKILSNGDYMNGAGKIIGNIGDYLP